MLNKPVVMRIIFFFSLTLIFGQNFDIQRSEIAEFVEKLESGLPVDLNAKYLWTGMISKIEELDESIEVTVISSRWTDNDKLATAKAVLRIKDPEMINKIKDIGLYRKIVFITKVILIKEGNIPVCIPFLIRRV